MLQTPTSPVGATEGIKIDDVLPYRADIDGLRAVAVTAVVVFHAGFSGLPGGFMGVDVFFVISGYLIGAHVFRQSAGGTFSYLAFYARRLRRLLPALLSLIGAFFVIGWFVLTPDELRELGKESVAAIAGASNVLFYLGGDYFAPAADMKPLLHTWSLGVEEQFYILLPLLAIFMTKVIRIRPFVGLAVVTAISFGASIVLVQQNAQAAFYLLPTRFWELSIGALLAISSITTERRFGIGVQRVVACGGTVLIGLAFVAYEPAFGFPGVLALLPTVGTVLIIASPTSLLNRGFLANPVTVFVGKVSYSWYLWHWPVFYVARVLGAEHSVHPAVLAATSFGMAVVSWRLIEQPFRQRRSTNGQTVGRYCAAMLVMAAVGTLFYHQNGFPSRLDPSARQAAEDARRSQDDPCLLRNGDITIDPLQCSTATPGQASVTIIGDSHAASIAPGFEALASQHGMGFRQSTKSLCTAQWGYANLVSDLPYFVDECLDYQAGAFEAVENDQSIRVVVLASRWSLEQELVATSAGSVMDLEAALEATVRRLTALGRRVVLVQDVPAFTFDPYARVIGEALPLRADIQSLLRAPADDGIAAVADVERDTSRQILERVAARHDGVSLFDPWTNLCSVDGCRYRFDEALFYFDNQHLTAAGARRAVGREAPWR